MRIAVPRETAPGERRVALVPESCKKLIQAGYEIVIESTAGEAAGFADAAYYNLLLAAISTIPVLATGILAWQFALEGQKLKGILLLHLVLACASTVMIWLIWWIHFRARHNGELLFNFYVAVELLAVALVSLTAHLGGFLSGVNAPG